MRRKRSSHVKFFVCVGSKSRFQWRDRSTKINAQPTTPVAMTFDRSFWICSSLKPICESGLDCWAVQKAEWESPLVFLLFLATVGIRLCFGRCGRIRSARRVVAGCIRFRLFGCGFFRFSFGGLVCFGGFLVGIAAIIGFIKTAAFEHDCRASAKLSNRFVFTALRAFLDRIVRDFLEQLPSAFTVVTDIVVSWHNRLGCEISTRNTGERFRRDVLRH